MEGGGFFRCGRPYFTVQKSSDFSKFMAYGQEGGGVEPVRTFFGQSGRVNFQS